MTKINLFIISLFSIVLISAQEECLSPVEIHGALSVDGNRIVNSEGEPAVMAGNSFFWSNNGFGAEEYYSREMVEYLASDWNTSIVRAAMGVGDEYGGYNQPQYTASNLARTKVLIDAALEFGLYVIVDWHSHDAEHYQAEAIDFFTQIAEEYGEHPNIIYEVYNEPIHVSWSNVVKPYAEAVIDAIRKVDPDNLIIVGSPTWSQDVDVVAGDRITGETNIAYTIHFYAGTHGQSLRNKCQVALDAGLALFCTEWGTVNADGDGDVDATSTAAWMEFLQENGISHCNWSVHNKAEGASIFKPGTRTSGGWSDSDLTASGALVKSIILNWGIGCFNGGLPPETAWTRHFTSGSTGDISVEFNLIEDFGDDFNGEIIITNNGAPVTGYTLGFTAPWDVTEFWNEAVSSKNGNNYIVDTNSHEFLGGLATGQSQSIGFTAHGEPSEPTNYLFDGSSLDTGEENDNIAYETWRSTYSLPNNSSDADNDGYADLIEFFFGTVPNDAKSSPSLDIKVVEEAQEKHFSITFRINPLAENVEYRFETSNDLETWTSRENGSMLSFSSETSDSDGMLEVTWVSDNPISTIGETLFTRMQVRETE